MQFGDRFPFFSGVNLPVVVVVVDTVRVVAVIVVAVMVVIVAVVVVAVAVVRVTVVTVAVVVDAVVVVAVVVAGHSSSPGLQSLGPSHDFPILFWSCNTL